MNALFESDKKYIANTYNRFPIEIVGGKGSIAYGADGIEYIDMGSGIAVNTFGFCDESFNNAVIAQLNAFQHTSNLYYQKPCVDLAKLLCERSGLKKVFLANSGAEANECAIKVARKYSLKKGEGYHNIITLKQSFHGRTITTLSATGQDVFHKNFGPFTQGFLYAEANNYESVKELVEKEKVCAVMIECVQGEGGINVLDKEFVKCVYKLCSEKDILFIVDEIQTGNGRCGKYFCYQNYGVLPDIVTTAKGLGGGLPIGACIMGEKTENVLSAGDHGSTFGANPVSCAGAVNIVNRIDEKLLKEVAEKGEFIKNSLQGKKGIESVSGLGLMLGVKTEKPPVEIVKKCLEKGVILLTAKDKVRLLPALNIPFELLEKATAVIAEVCGE